MGGVGTLGGGTARGTDTNESTLTPGPAPNTVRAADGMVLLAAPEGWVLLPPGDAGLTRSLKATGDRRVVQENGWTP